LAVADGVGGWASHNVNPGLYSGLLTRHVVELGTKHPSASLEEIIHQANWKAAKKHLGSATCTALKLTGPNQITTLNVGDSGYSIHRKIGDELKLVFVSEVGQKRFNFPHQLGGEHGDEVKDVAVEMTHTLEPNDIIVVYSDGVSDNLFPGEFHACLDNAMDEENALQSFGLAADCIARKAYFLGKDKEFDSPFAQGARKAGWQNYKGGKHDDITVVVAQISTTPTFEDPYLEESIFLYTGKVGAVEGLPSLASLMKPADGGEL
jgi:protein phosphatase PTC7